jgi:nitrogen fixation/metabolism regulation signal transduction histidine kinase
MAFFIMTALVSFVLQVLSNPFRPLAEHVRNLSWTHGPVIMVMLFLLPVFVIDTIKLSHRFAGPIFALRRAMREVVQGKPARQARFRSNDFWHELAEDYNAMLAKLGANTEGTEAITDDEAALAAGDERSAYFPH